MFSYLSQSKRGMTRKKTICFGVRNKHLPRQAERKHILTASKCLSLAPLQSQKHREKNDQLKKIGQGLDKTANNSFSHDLAFEMNLNPRSKHTRNLVSH